jgi:hypothetical protein
MRSCTLPETIRFAISTPHVYEETEPEPFINKDSGHRHFAGSLASSLQKIDVTALYHIEARHYYLFLQHAAWMVQNNESESDVDSDTDEQQTSTSTALSRPPPRDNGPAPQDGDDAIEAALAEKRHDMFFQITIRIAEGMAPLNTKWYNERLGIIYALIRRAIVRDKSLCLVAQRYPNSQELLRGPDVTVSQLQTILLKLLIKTYLRGSQRCD